jgi:glucokinase
MADGAAQAARLAGVDVGDCVSVGIGSPGLCDSCRGVVVFAGNLNFANAPVVDEMRKHIAPPVFLSNDANCAALGEALAGAAAGTRHMVMVTLGTGVGSGIIIDGKIYTGVNGAAGEIGHMVLVPEGELCTCGERGCLEAYASATALIRQAQYAAMRYPESLLGLMVEGDLNEITGKTVFLAAERGDAAAERVVAEYIGYLGAGLVSIVNIFRPEVVLVGGGVSHAGDALMAPLQRYVQQHSFGSRYVDAPPVRRAALGNDAGIIGAAMLSAHNCG